MANFNIAYIYSLKDKFSQNMDKINAKVNENAKYLNKAKANLNSFSTSAMNMGKSMALKVSAPIIALGTLAVKNWSDQEQAVAQLKTAIESTGGAAKLSLQTLNREASRLQRETIFGDDTIIQGVTNQLLTFTNISGDNFLKLQKATLDVSSRFYGANANAETLRATSIMLGKALNDPIANLGALGRAGIQFSNSQKELIKNLAENNNLGKAQAIIIKELERQFGGSAKAIAQSGLGPLKQVINLIQDALEPIGGLIISILTPLIPSIIKITDKLNLFVQNNPKLTKIILIFASILAVLAPIIIVFAMIVKSVVVLISVFTILLNPITWIVAAIVALVGIGILLYKNFEPFKKLVDGIWTAIKNAVIFFYNLYSIILKLVLKFMEITGVLDVIKIVGNFILNIFKSIFNYIGKIISFGGKILSSFNKNVEKLNLKMSGNNMPNILNQKNDKNNMPSMSQALQGQNGKFFANININAPKGTVQSIQTKEKKSNNFNLGLNMQESYL